MRHRQGLKMSRHEDLLALCSEDILYWRRRSLNVEFYREELSRLNELRPDIFVFCFEQGVVSIRAKNMDAEARDIFESRARIYLNFFNVIAQRFVPDLNLDVAVTIADCAAADERIPILSFQKEAGETTLLLPDIDFLLSDFYQSPQNADVRYFDLKLDKAIFVGSTTGIDPGTRKAFQNTQANIQENPSERIRSARFFQDHPDVVFKLPGIVQCDSIETENYLRSIDFCSGPQVSWPEQYDYRYIVSLDGNGATCSRVALALRSNSVLVKYHSRNVLHYFKALLPWVHYVPVADEKDLESVLEYGRLHPELMRRIAGEACRFYDKFLTRLNLHRYMAILLNEMSELVGSAELHAARSGSLANIRSDFDFSVHLSGVGDVWCWPESQAGRQGSGHAIEAFSISSGKPDLESSDIVYQCLNTDGSIGPWVCGGVLSGSKGHGQALAGFRVRIRSTSNFGRMSLRYRASFVGGFHRDWVNEDEWCFYPGRMPLESFELELREI